MMLWNGDVAPCMDLAPTTRKLPPKTKTRILKRGKTLNIWDSPSYEKFRESGKIRKNVPWCGDFPFAARDCWCIRARFKEMKERPIKGIFEEIDLPDRRELDRIIMGEILGLSEEEQLEVYKAVIDLVKARIERARSVKKAPKRIKGIDVDALINSVLKELGGKLKRFPDDYIGVCECRELEVPKGKVEVGSDLQGFYVRVEGQEIRCESPYEAKYIQYAIINGHTKIKIPVDKNILEKAVEEYELILRETKKRISDFLETAIPDRKVRRKIEDVVWEKLWKDPIKA